MSTQLEYTPAQDDALFNGLRKMCVPDFWSADSPVRQPFAVEIDGEPWTAFTEGHVMAVVRGGREGVEPYSGKHDDSLRRTLALLSPQGGEWHRGVDYAALRDWVGVEMVGKCPVCLGTGQEPSELSDSELNARLNGEPDLRLGSLFGLPVQRSIVEIPFAHLKAGTVDVFVPDGTAAPIIVAAADWRLMWMPLNGWDEELPEFPQPADAERP